MKKSMLFRALVFAGASCLTSASALSQALVSSTGGSTASAPSIDFDGNGRVDAVDLQHIAQHIAWKLSGYDYDRNGIVNTNDWLVVLARVELQGPRHTKIIFDLNADGVVNGRDWMEMSRTVSMAPQGATQPLRYDFNGDGVINHVDRTRFAQFLRSSNPSAVFDLDGNQTFNSADLALIARDLDMVRLGYRVDLRADVNGDGVVNIVDWRDALAHARSVHEKIIYDTEGTDRVLDVLDAENTGNAIASVDTGARASIRYDFNGDGSINRRDWSDFVRYAVVTLRRPEIVLDIDQNRTVDWRDSTMLAQFIQSGSLQTRYDVNGDGSTNSRDILYLGQYTASEPAAFPSPWTGDVTRDGCLNSHDVARIEGPWFGSSRHMAAYDPDFDVNADGMINQVDQDAVRYSPFWNRCQADVMR